MIRTFLVLFAILLAIIILGIPFMLIVYLIGLVSKMTARRIAYGFARFVFRIFLFLSGTKVTVDTGSVCQQSPQLL